MQLLEHRFERIFYWPDPKGLGARQIRDVLTKQDDSVTEASSLPGKSVALQGLPALEYLLYADGADALTKTGNDGTFRCRFARAVAGNLAGMSKEIVDGWQDGAPYARSYLEPGPANSAYHNPKEVTLELFKTFTAGIEWVRDQKLAKTLGASPEKAKASPVLPPTTRRKAVARASLFRSLCSRWATERRRSEAPTRARSSRSLSPALQTKTDGRASSSPSSRTDQQNANRGR